MRKYFENTFIIPSSFTIAGGRKIKVVIEDCIGDSFGRWNDAKCEILIANKIKIDDEIIEVTMEDKVRTFWHECGHAFDFFYGISKDAECFANTFSMFIFEILKTAEYNEI